VEQIQVQTICPAPTTPSFFTSKDMVVGVEENCLVIEASLVGAAFRLAVESSMFDIEESIKNLAGSGSLNCTIFLLQ
jgi:hypothetical protein